MIVCSFLFSVFIAVGGLETSSVAAQQRYRTLQRQQLRSTLRSPGTLAARVGLHFLTGVLMGSWSEWIYLGGIGGQCGFKMFKDGRLIYSPWFRCFFVWRLQVVHSAIREA